MRSLTRWIIIVGVVTALFAGVLPSLMQDDERFPRSRDAELEVITELNQWRLRRGLGPLARNSDLDALAMMQAEFIAPRVPFTDVVDFHTDEFGDGVRARAEYFGWPAYDLPERVLVSEIAAYYPDVAGAINFWQTSPVHRAAATYNGYREVGVAVLQNQNWLVVFVVLGGRPQVLPVMYDPVRGLLLISLDYSYYSDRFVPTRMQLLDLQGNRLHAAEWLVWDQRLRVPPDAPNEMRLIMTDGIITVESPVNLRESSVYPSQPFSALATSTPTPERVVQAPPTQAPTAVPSATPAARAESYDLWMVYDDYSFSLVNLSGRALDLEPLVIRSDLVDLTIEAQWLGQYSRIPVQRFPANYCMQAWSFIAFSGPPALPDGCFTLASGRSSLPPRHRFWLAEYFDVYYARQPLIRCTAASRECGVDLP